MFEGVVKSVSLPTLVSANKPAISSLRILFNSSVPKYLSFVFIGSHALIALRALRLLRVFRILKLTRYLGASVNLITALKASRIKIFVLLFSVLVITIILGTVMYLIEGPENGFTSIPYSMYWAIVTLTTVGYGDVAPQTSCGQALSVVVMILGYSIIAVPTGIVTVEMAQAFKENVSTKSCQDCSSEGHDSDAKHCKYCGEEIRGQARKCKHCGEYQRAADRQRFSSEKGKYPDSESLAAIDWVLGLLCSSIAFIVAIGYICQGKKKGVMLLILSIAAIAFWTIVRIALVNA